jgi:putative ABC transport system permease protein
MLVFLNLIFTPSLLEGVISTANSKLRDTLTSDITVESSEPGGLMSDAIQLASQISKIDGVSSSTPSRTISAQIELGSERGTVEVTGIETNSFSDVYTLPKFMLEGSFLKPGDRNQIVLGAQIAGADKAKLELYADSLKNAHAGDTVTLKFANGNKKNYTVKGIFQTDFIQTDLKTLITSDEYSEVLPTTTNKASAINVKLKPGASQENVNNQIKQINSNITTRTWQERAGFVKSYTSSLELVNKILRAVALFVAFLTIFIITYVDIVNKKRQIGISRAIGISTTTIVMSYIIRAVFYTILGVVIGTLVFVLVIVPIEARFPFSFPLGDVLLSVNPAFIFRNAQILLLVSIVSALLPAFQAVRSKIVDAIWGQ